MLLSVHHCPQSSRASRSRGQAFLKAEAFDCRPQRSEAGAAESWRGVPGTSGGCGPRALAPDFQGDRRLWEEEPAKGKEGVLGWPSKQ